MGKKVILVQRPDGYTSRYYKVTVGKVYTVIDTSGSCYIIKDDTGENAMIARERFVNAMQEADQQH